MILFKSDFYGRLRETILHRDFHGFNKVVAKWPSWRKLEYAQGLELLILTRKRWCPWAASVIILVSDCTPQDGIDVYGFGPMG